MKKNDLKTAWEIIGKLYAPKEQPKDKSKNAPPKSGKEKKK